MGRTLLLMGACQRHTQLFLEDGRDDCLNNRGLAHNIHVVTGYEDNNLKIYVVLYFSGINLPMYYRSS